MLTKREAATYAAGGSIRRFDRWRKHGLLPGRVPGTTMFDRRLIDAALDKLAGTASDVSGAAIEDPLTKWKRERDERKSNSGR